MIGHRLKAAREAKGLTQQQVAERLSVNRQTVSNWENEGQSISQDHVINLARIYTCSLDYLYGLTNQMYIGYYEEQEVIVLNGLKDSVNGK